MPVLAETRLVFYSDGLVLAGAALAIAGAAVFWGLLVHWMVRARAWALALLLLVPPALILVAWLRRPAPADAGDAPRGEAVPALPWRHLMAGFVLAGAVGAAAAWAAASAEPARQLVLMAAMAVAAGAWVLFFYLRVYEDLGRGLMAALVAMRAAAVVLLVLLIFKPTLSYEQRLERRTDLHILVDVSRSMSVSDWPDTPQRMDRATAQVQEHLGRLQTAFDVHLHAFDTRARPARVGEWPEPEGEATNLARSLKDVLASARPADTTAVILASDGIHNAGGDVVAEVTALGPPPIYTVGVGTDLSTDSGFQDIVLSGVDAPEETVVGNVARLTVQVDAVGLADRSVMVDLREGDRQLASAPLRLDATPGAQNVTLTVTPAEVGRHTYTVRIRPDPAERRTENNTRDVYLAVTDPKIRALYVEGVVRPEYKFLKQVLETDPNVELAALIQVRRGEFLQSGSMTGVTLTGFPRTLDDMRAFDVYVVGDLDRSYFSAEQFENLKSAVGEGRGLVMLGGYNSFGPGGYAGTAMEAMLPVSVGPRDIGQETMPFVPRLTPEGENHPVFYGLSEFFGRPAGRAPAEPTGEMEAPRDSLPPLKGCTVLGPPKPGADVLAVHPDRPGPDGKPLTVLAVQTYGQGRTAAFAADTTYQWYLAGRVLGRASPYVKFWGQLVRWLASKDVKDQSTEPGVFLLVRKPFYSTGETVRVRAKVRAEDGRATNFAQVAGVLVGPGGEREPFGLALGPGGMGVYEAELDAPDPGNYRVVVEAKKDRKTLGAQQTDFTVGRPNQEFDRLGIDRDLLTALAEATGGAYYETDTFGDLVERLRSRTLQEDVHREVGLATEPGLFGFLFAVFLATVTAEWLVRRRYQLN